MTGKELIIYILENDLGDSPVFEDNTFIGFVPAGRVAEELGIGLTSLWIKLELYDVDYIEVNGDVYLPFDYKSKLPNKK